MQQDLTAQQQASKATECQSLIIMGVAGSGKSTLALRLAEQLGWCYLEGDDFHSAEAKQMMACGTPITSEMRDQWGRFLFSLTRLRSQTTAGGIKLLRFDP